MDVIRDRHGDLLERLQLEGETLSQDELLGIKEELRNDYALMISECGYKDIDKLQQLMLLVDKLLNLD